MATDFSQVPDAQMDYIMGLLENNPAFIPNEEERRAFVAEYFGRPGRRYQAPAQKPAKPTTNVDQNLDAAASPIAVEPMAGPRRWQDQTDEETLAKLTDDSPTASASELPAYGRKYRKAVSDRIDAADDAYLARKEAGLGRQDPRQQAYDEATGLVMPSGMSTEIMPNAGSRPAWAENAFGGEMINVDGVMVQAYDLGDGKMRYRLGDVKRAQEAAIDAQRSAELSKNAQEDLANYGTRQLYQYDYNPDGSIRGVSAVPSAGLPGTKPLSAEEEAQQDRLGARKAAEARQYAQNRALAMMPGRVRQEREEDARRMLVARNAQLAGGSLNLNPRMRAQIGALRTAEDPGTDPDIARVLRYSLPGGAAAADVDKAHNEQLTQLGLRVAQGQGFQQMTPEQQALLGLRLNEAERAAPAEERAANYKDSPQVHPSEEQMVGEYVSEVYSAPGSAWSLGGLSSSFTAAEQQQTVDWLVNEKGYKPEKARMIVDGIARKRGGQSWFGNWDGT